MVSSDDTTAPLGSAGAAAEAARAEGKGYAADKEALLKRVARIEAQVRGMARMVEDDRYCMYVLTQIGAVRAALDKVALGLLDGHARTCLVGAEDEPAKVSEMMEAVGRLVRG